MFIPEGLKRAEVMIDIVDNSKVTKKKKKKILQRLPKVKWVLENECRVSLIGLVINY